MVKARLLLATGLSIAALLWAPAASAAAPTDPDYAAIDSYVGAQMPGLPGLALGIVHEDRAVHVQGFGAATLKGAAVTPDTPFVLGSLSKSFTALAISQLVDAGKLDLDSPVTKYLPWFRVNPPESSGKITIRNLLNQTSGLPVANPQPPVPSIEKRVRELSSTTLKTVPGTGFEYSNDNYITLGVVIEAVTGQSYAAYVQRNIFDALDMKHSFTSDEAAKRAGLASGYVLTFGVSAGYDSSREDFVPSGRLISSANDMTHFMVAQLNHGKYLSTAVASPARFDEMHRGVAATDVAGSRYAMGWISGDSRGIKTVWHNGSNFNYHSDLIMAPDTRWGVVVLANADSVPTLLLGSVDRIAAGVINMLHGRAADKALAPWSFYLGFDLIVLLVFVSQLWSIARALRQRPVSFTPAPWPLLRHLILPAAWRLIVVALLVAIVVGLAVSVGADLGQVLTTDVASAFVSIAIVVAISGAVRLTRTVRRFAAEES
jgi:CubicO group peptidase (beta-lactamase class C family)